MSAKGYNSHYNFDPQVNLFYMFASDQQLPVFYRIFPGNISGMKALNLSIKESGATKALAIGDKGFCSEENIQMLEETVLDYILPLRRDSSYLNYSRLEQALYDKAFDGHFMHYGRPVFYYTMPNYKAIITNKKPENPNKFEAYIYQENGVQGNSAQGNGEYVMWIKEQLITITQRQLLASLKQTPASLGADSEITDKELLDGLRRFVIKNKIKGVNFDSSKKTVIFVDRALRLEEERTYLSRIDDKVEGYDLEGYQDKQLSFGTIGLITNCISHDPKSVYLNFKTRMEVETVFDAYKNLLEADRSYMQSDNSMNGWMFINHISVMLYYKLLNLIKSKNMEGQISPQDVLIILQKINKVKINNEWHISEISSRNIKTLTKLGLPVTY
jgi:transposase